MCVCVKLLLSCPTLCDPMDCSLPGSSVHGILQARYWSQLPFPPPGDLPNPETEPMSPGSCTAGRFFIPEPPGKHYMSAISQFKIFSQRKRVM